MRAVLVSCALLSLLVAGCGGDDSGEADAVTTTREDVAATSSAPERDDTTATDDGTTTSSSTSTTTTASPTPTRTRTSTPSTTTQAVPQAPEPCSPAALSDDLLGSPSGVGVIECEHGWAYAYYEGGDGDADFIAQRQGDTWVHVATMGSPVCREELMDQGAPPSVVRVLIPCDEMYPPEGGSQEPDTDCTIPTEQYGATYAFPLRGLTCDEAAGIWYSAADYGAPSFETPISSQGWDCYVYPYDPGSYVAGACYSHSGGEEFVLNVP